MRCRTAITILLLLGIGIAPMTPQAAGRFAREPTPATFAELYDEEGLPAICYICGRTADQVHAIYSDAIHTSFQAQREQSNTRFEKVEQQYAVSLTAWEELLVKAGELPELILKMRFESVRREMDTLATDHPVLRDLEAYPTDGIGQFMPEPTSELVAWVTDNPPPEPDHGARDFSLALIDEGEEAALAHLDEMEMLQNLGIGLARQPDRVRDEHYTFVESVHRTDDIIRADAFEVVAALQRVQALLEDYSQWTGATDEEFTEALAQTETRADILSHITFERYRELVARRNQANLNDDPDKRWQEYQETFRSYAAFVPICAICAEE